MITPDQMTQIVETIKTLNLNIDSQSAIQITETLKPILWTIALKPYFQGAIIGIIIMGISLIIYKAFLKSSMVNELSKAVNKYIKKIESLDEDDIRDSLKEILDYMPRNKKKRRSN